MRTIIILMLFFINNCYANKLNKDINVSVSIIYDCSLNDEKIKKYCDDKKPLIKIEDNYIIKEY